MTFVAVLLLVLTGGVAYYLTDVRGPMTEVSLESDELVSISNGNWLVIEPTSGYSKGLIFLQGGKVLAEAYVPLLRPLAEAGILVVLPKAPVQSNC